MTFLLLDAISIT